jgi:hypothetical protein
VINRTATCLAAPTRCSLMCSLANTHTFLYVRVQGAMVTVKRGKATVFEGKLTSLRRVKDNVEEVRTCPSSFYVLLQQIAGCHRKSGSRCGRLALSGHLNGHLTTENDHRGCKTRRPVLCVTCCFSPGHGGPGVRCWL